MLASDFQRKIRKLNKNLRIYCGDNDARMAGLYHVVNGEYIDIIGVDKHYMPEFSIVDEKGHILKGGWRRVIKLLIQKGLVDRRKAEKVFGSQIIGTRWPNSHRVWVDPINKAIQDATTANFIKHGKPVLHKDEIMDFAKAITKRNQE